MRRRRSRSFQARQGADDLCALARHGVAAGRCRMELDSGGGMGRCLRIPLSLIYSRVSYAPSGPFTFVRHGEVTRCCRPGSRLFVASPRQDPPRVCRWPGAGLRHGALPFLWSLQGSQGTSDVRERPSVPRFGRLGEWSRCRPRGPLRGFGASGSGDEYDTRRVTGKTKRRG